MRNLRFLVLTLLSISFITNYAQTSLDQVLVSASRIQSKKFESGKNITVFQPFLRGFQKDAALKIGKGDISSLF